MDAFSLVRYLPPVPREGAPGLAFLEAGAAPVRVDRQEQATEEVSCQSNSR